MANLTNLLDPASSSSSPQAMQSQPQPAPLNLDGQDHGTNTNTQAYGQMRGHGRNNSVTSPGLEALATAASMSPTQPSTGFGALQQQQTYSDFGMRTKPHKTGLDQYGQSARTLSTPRDHNAPARPNTIDQQTPSLPPYESGNQMYVGAVNGHESESMEDVIPATSQIRQPAPGPLQTLPNGVIPPTQSEQVQVKTEISDNNLNTAQNGIEQLLDSAQLGPGTGLGLTLPDPLTEMPAPQSVSNVKKDPSNAPSPAPVDENAGTNATKPKPPPKRKRAAPKKGTASTVKPPSKKRKVDSESIDGSPSGQRSGTPATSRASMTPAPRNRKQPSATPTPRSSSVLNGQDDEDYDEDDQLYCICRKPDDHRMMIGCDGPCAEWFHLDCVNMNEEKVALVSKWYCTLTSGVQA